MSLSSAELIARTTPLKLPLGSNILSIDVEDWYHISCEESTRWLLDLFDEKQTTATFFVLGEVAERRRELVREIHARGHEVGMHAWRHVPLTRLTPETFREDVLRGMQVLSDITGVPVLGFRAPIFSVFPSNAWVFDILAEAGIRYDSSVFPIKGPRYGIPDFPRHAVRYSHEGRSIIEVPLSTVRAGGRNWPVSGGGYFRIMPHALIHRAVQAVRRDGMPFVLYCHPYEFNTEPLRHAQQDLSLEWCRCRLKAFKSNLFRRTMRSKLKCLLDTHLFTSFQEALAHEL